MSFTWSGDGPPLRHAPIGWAGWLRVGLRGGAILLILAVCFPLQQLIRLVERPLCGAQRPVTPWITQGVCIATCAIMGLTRKVEGQPMRMRGALVANHVSWLDIFVLNACDRIYFVAKSEVRGWGGIGWLARGTGTVFVERRRGDAARQRDILTARLLAGHRLLLFPEGTSTDGKRVLQFRSTLFESFLTPELNKGLAIQPVSVVYRAPGDADPRFYGWWGDTGFGGSLLQVLAAAPNGEVTIVFHPPVKTADFTDRKALANATERSVRQGLESRLS